jgi:hypothetical protein
VYVQDNFHFPELPPPKNFVFPPFPIVTTFDPTTNYCVPVSYNWNLAVEQQLAPDWLLRVAYVGNHGSNILETVQLNPAVYIPGSALSINQRALLPPYGGIFNYSQDINSSYNSLQVSVQKRCRMSGNYPGWPKRIGPYAEFWATGNSAGS